MFTWWSFRPLRYRVGSSPGLWNLENRASAVTRPQIVLGLDWKGTNSRAWEQVWQPGGAEPKAKAGWRRRGGKRRPSLPPSQGRASTPGRSLVAAGAGRLQAAALLSPAAAGRAHCSRRAEPRGGGSPSRVPRGARPGSRRSVPPPLGLTADSHRPDCIINVNGAASVSCEGSSGLVLCDTHPGILTREKAASQQGWKISLSGTHSKCHGKRSDFKTVSSRWLRTKIERRKFGLKLGSYTPIVYLSRFYMNKIPNTSLCKTRDLRKSVQTHFDNPQPGRRRPGPRKTSPWVSELIREPTGNRGRRHT